METMFPAFDADLARLIHSTRHSIRTVLERHGFIEITHPNLDPGSRVAHYNTFQVTIPGNKRLADFRGTLLVSGSRYLVEATRHVGPVYRIGPSFRGESEEAPNRVFEFESLHVSFGGVLNDAQDLLEEILSEAVDAARHERSIDNSNLRDIAFPLPRVSYAEAIATLGLRHGSDLSADDHRRLLSRLNTPALFLTGNPQSVNPYAAFHRVVDGAVQNYELILRLGGESFAGGEYEVDTGRLREQLSTSSLLKRAAELDIPPEQYARPMLELLAAPTPQWKTGPVFIYGSLERLVMFIRQVEQISEASLYPVTGNFLGGSYQPDTPPQ
jgi:aspartyl/asparaginyl-tRNA synthetase